MTEEEALVLAVCETPDDDTPRLVYADWLDEHDKPERAEFIRLQCEWVNANTDGVELEKLRWMKNRIDELLKLHELEWLDPNWPKIGSLSTAGTKWPYKPETKWVPCWAPQWSRGFVSGLSIPQSALLELGEEWAAVGPPPSFAKSPITQVIFSDNAPAMDDDWGSESEEYYFWRRGDTATGSGRIVMTTHNIHPLLFNLMKNDEVELRDPSDEHLKLFKTKKRALDALSDAAVAYGYSKAFPEKPRRV